MKTIVTSLCALLAICGQAQNVGIGTATPHASAALHVSSTTRGLLPPRMTTTQRTNIATPLNGLMVYDTDAERIYVYADGVWRYILSNDTWATNGTAVYQGSLDVGIGNANPQEKLHVTGNIRATGEVQANGGMTINNLTGTITFQSAAVDKGFLQLSGDNLRIGTHSPNTTGKVVIRTGGSDRIFVNSDGFMGFNIAEPLARIDLNGNMRISGKMQTTTTGSTQMLPAAYGLIRSNAIIESGSGNFSASRVEQGIFNLVSNDFNTTTVVVASCTATNVTIGAGQGSSANTLTLYLRNMDTGELIDAWFNFVAFTR
jgi:hypothetical protein